MSKIGSRCKMIAGSPPIIWPKAALESPDAAARPNVDVVDAALAERGASPDVVGEMRVPAVDEDVVSLYVWHQPINRLRSTTAAGTIIQITRGGPQLCDELVDRPRPRSRRAVRAAGSPRG